MTKPTEQHATTGSFATKADVELRLESYRLQWLDRTGYLRRRMLFLDLNFWIRLTEPVGEEFRTLAELLRDRVARGLLICPAAPTLVMELEKLRAGPRRDRRAALMQTLSQGLALRAHPLVIVAEYRRAVIGQAIPRAVAYSCLWDAFASDSRARSWSLDFTDTGMTPDQMEIIAGQLFDVMAEISIQTMPAAPTFLNSRADRLGALQYDLGPVCGCVIT